MFTEKFLAILLAFLLFLFGAVFVSLRSHGVRLDKIENSDRITIEPSPVMVPSISPTASPSAMPSATIMPTKLPLKLPTFTPTPSI